MKTLLVLSTLLVVVSLGMSACGSGTLSGPTPAPTSIPLPTATPTPTQAPTPSAEEIHNLIVNALLALYTKPNRMEVTTVLADGQTRTGIIEFVPPDRKHLVDPGENVEYIAVGDKVYAKTITSGQWEETQIPAATFMGGGAITAQAIGETMSDARFIRNDTLDGKAVIVYGYNSTAKAGVVELNSQAELWVGEDDGLPYKMITDGETYSASFDPATGESTLSAVKTLMTALITFDPAITIEPPLQ
jgi:hypothetical protein